MSRHTRLSTVAQSANAPTPQTPAGFTISTPQGESAGDSTAPPLQEALSGTSTDYLHNLSLSLSPSLYTNTIQVSRHNNDQLTLSSPSFDEEPGRPERACYIEEELLRSRQYEAAGRCEEATEIWTDLMKQIYESASPSRIFNAMNTVFAGRTLSFRDAEILFESNKCARVREYGIYNQLTTDLCLGYIKFILDVLSMDMEKNDLDLDVTLSRIGKAASLLKEIFGAYFSEEVTHALMPHDIDVNILPESPQAMRTAAKNGHFSVQVLDEIARVCAKEPLLVILVTWTSTYEDIRFHYTLEKSIRRLVDMGLVTRVNTTDGKPGVQLAPWLRPKNEGGGHMAFDVLDIPGREKLTNLFK
ncbi:hypothetical protein PISL3812_08427 [Talaromyces islandicus]|uniref:Uncharacterized protein n=1 Tax=Talaromyces islandicus TaxID=28573 RepID=A0A0U1M728_TALIS|nr:hypothetical protein PISL3812_08427 [Talaromyces islandicus]